MSSYPTDYRSLPPGVTLSPADHDLYAEVREIAGQHGADCRDVMRHLRKRHDIPLASLQAVADALGGPGAGKRDFPS